MGRELVTREIDGKQYEFHEFNTTQSLNISVRLGKILAKTLGMSLSAFDFRSAKATLLDFNQEKIAGAVEALLANLDQKEVVDLVETLVAKDNVLCDGKRVVFNSHYAGNLPHLFRVLGAALEVQYGTFFAAIKEWFGGPIVTSTPAP